MIYLEPPYLALVKAILKNHVPNLKVAIFGSRVTQKIKPYSDIDLVLMNDKPLPIAKLAALREAFEESDLPYKVDIVQWCALSPEFKERIGKTREVVK